MNWKVCGRKGSRPNFRHNSCTAYRHWKKPQNNISLDRRPLCYELYPVYSK